MINSSKRIVILNNLKSRNIEQAIFILKDDTYSETDAVNEAEKIVEGYLKRLELEKKKKAKSRKWPAWVTNLCIVSSVMGIIYFLTRFL